MDVEAVPEGRVPAAVLEQAAAVAKHIANKPGTPAPTTLVESPASLPASTKVYPQVSVGEKLPSLGVSLNGNAFNIKDYFAEKRGVIIGLPGAFSPMRMQSHVKGFHDNASELKKRISFLGCLAVNDPYVLKAWSRAARIESDMTFICDSDSLITQHLGLQQDLSSKGMGVRCKKFALIVGEGAVVKWLGLSDDEVSVDTVLQQLDRIFTDEITGTAPAALPETTGAAATDVATSSAASVEEGKAAAAAPTKSASSGSVVDTSSTAEDDSAAAPVPDPAAMQQPNTASTMTAVARKMDSNVQAGDLTKHSTMPIGALPTATGAAPPPAADSALPVLKEDVAVWNYIDHGRDWVSIPGLCKPPTNRQSPINIEDDRAIEVPSGPMDMIVKYDNNSTRYLVENDGHATRVKAAPGLAPMGSVVVDGETYFVDNFHFHSPSEHTFNGTDERRVVELHIVHVNDDRSKVVTIGVTFEPSEDDTPNPFLQAVLQAPRLPFNEPHKSELVARDDMRVILSESMFAWGEDDVDDSSDSSVIGDTTHPEFYRYAGSSTVPPCEENVTWFVKRESEPASDEQLERFALLLHSDNAPGGNARELHNTAEFNYNTQPVHIVRGSQKKR